MANRRVIEVFTAGCPLCNDTLNLVREAVSNCGCEVIERRCEGESCCEPALSYGVRMVPTIAINGQIVFAGKPTPEQARALLAL